ncbi:hypothetical protein FKW77_008310 [Venturia effusa]|uniref:Zona occludens toxin N-terminal domain-containing protein n=1 Tax=Venturia effusa TaxID=50376 RepID=A0A517KZU9_9PEZI|nr:hypothetical protein FKW77_008310 [Venturia effusa]
MSSFVFAAPSAQLNPMHQKHLGLFDTTNLLFPSTNNARDEEIRTAPIFSSHVQGAISNGSVGISTPSKTNSVFPQYGLLGMRLKTIGALEQTDPVPEPHQNLIYTNTNAPWSAFICGSQGGGKSHTLSCLLENALLSTSPAAVLPNPLAGLVFHYDNFTSHSSSQLCEAAYLCSKGVPVRVLVSPSNVWAMEKIYSNLPGLPKSCPKPQVVPLYISEKQLNVTNMMTLMSVDQSSGHQPLYLEVLTKVLRDMVMESKGKPGLKYSEFKLRLTAAGFSHEQTNPLKLRLQLLEAFMEQQPKPGAPAQRATTDVWQFEKGSLTIVDLSCPFVNSNDACALFSICLSLFMEGRSTGGRIVALDEAHKFLTQSSDALKFTEQLTSIIAQQRHLATRVVIATQEPTLSPRLLDLCNITIVHRFNSPAWYNTLRRHLAGTSLGEKNNDSGLEIFRQIVSLKTGEALVFCPKAMLDTVTENPGRAFAATTSLRELQSAYFKMQVRKRMTADGGKSIMAVEGSENLVLVSKSGQPKTNSSSFGAAPVMIGIQKEGLAASYRAPPAPSIAPQSLSKPLPGALMPEPETVGLFGSPKTGLATNFVAPPVPEHWQPKAKVEYSKPLFESTPPAIESTSLVTLPAAGVVTPFVVPPTPEMGPVPSPTLKQSKLKAEKTKSDVKESNSKGECRLRDVLEPQGNEPSASKHVARISRKRVASAQFTPDNDDADSSDDSLDSESESECGSESCDSSESDEKATKGTGIDKEAVESMSLHFASLGTQNQPLKKGKKPMPFRYQAHKSQDLSAGVAPNSVLEYQSITAGKSWLREVSFEVRRIIVLEDLG